MLKPADIILVHFPFTKNKKKEYKIRPVLLLEVIKHEVSLYKVCQITKTDRSDKFIGSWIDDETKLSVLGLKENSFINLQNVLYTTKPYIIKKIGTHPDLENLLFLLEDF